MITNHNYFHTFLLLSIHLLLSFTPITGQHSLELESGVQIRCFENERQALLKFKREIVDEYGRLSTWGIEENKRDCCKWRGVYCHNRPNHVTRLDLRAPSEDGYRSNTPLQESAYFMWKGAEVKYVKNLALVKRVDLSNNNLAGEIPAEITKLDDLIGLNLSRNNLIESIPRNIGEMKALDFLDLSRNGLSGGIPTSLSELSQLGILNLSNNNLSGRIPQNSHMLTFEEPQKILPWR